jgi:hypothetical protein
VLSLVLAASSLVLASPNAVAADADLRVDLPTTISAPALVAASGTAVVLDVSPSASRHLQLTTDNGHSFVDLANPVAAEGTVTDARGGKLVAYGVADDGQSSNVSVTDLATNTSSDPVTVPSTQLEAADPTTAVYVDAKGAYRAESLATSAARKLSYTPPKSGSPSVQVSLAAGPNALLAAFVLGSRARAGTGALDLVPLDGSASRRVSVAGLSAATLRGAYAIFVTTDTKGSNLCFLPVANWVSTAKSCTTMKAPGKGDQRDAWSDLAVGSSWVQWTLSSSSGSTTYLSSGTVKPGTLTKVATSGDVELGVTGDPDRPLALVGAGQSGYVGAVTSKGALTRQFGFPRIPANPQVLELAPDRVSGLDSRPFVGGADDLAWQRPLSSAGVGADSTGLFPRAVDLGASAARTLLDDGTRLKLYDRGRYVRTLARSTYGSLPGLISGPYYPANTLAYVQALRVDGTALKTGMITGLFGSLVLVRTNAALGRYDVVDLVGGESVRVNVPVNVRLQGFTLQGLWGDWVYGITTDPDNSLIPYTLAINYRTGAFYQRYGLPVDYGDGFVAMQYADDDDQLRLEVWNPVTGAAEDIPDLDWDVAVTDGTGRLAYSTATQLVVRTLTVPTVAAPRLLGVVAPATINLITAGTRSWLPEIDTTKALGAGTLTVRNSAGEVVWTTATPASDDGSIRGTGWTGQYGDGGAGTGDVPLGDYTWQLVAPAADGSGNVVGIDGTPDFGDAGDASDGVSGTIHVVNTSLGTVKGSTPTVAGSAKVDQTLTARPGTWTPSNTRFSYQWHRTVGKTVTDVGTNAASYKATAADVGGKLSVTVTGAVDGWKSTRTTSKLTATVVKAGFTVPTPKVGGGTPKVGATVTAQAGSWKPTPTTITYAWYRVKGSRSSLARAATTDPTYVVQAKDARYTLKVKVTGSRAGYNTASKYSKVTRTVAKS